MGAWWESGEYALAVYDSVAELDQAIPPELADLVRQNLFAPAVEDLDI